MKTKLIAIGAISLLGGVNCASVAAKDRPNILFLFVDDLGYADVGFNGSKYYETPNIDAIAQQSVIFENSYTYPTSSPSRAALLTGQQSFRTGVYTVPVLEKGDSNNSIFSRWTIPTEFPFYSEVLADEGYKSIHLGKWHLVGPYPDEEMAMEYPFKERLQQPSSSDFSWVARHKEDDIKLKYYPEGRGFVKNVGGTYRGDPALEVGGYKNVNGGYHAPFSNPFIEPKEDDEWLTDRLTDEAIEFIDEYKDEPFFINLHFYAVHAPFVKRSEELHQKYMDKTGDSILGQGVDKTTNRGEVNAAYATMVESVDDNVGRLIDHLRECGELENTIIVFSSDNGWNMGANDLMRGKKTQIYEGGVRVPTFVYWENNMKPRRVETPISILDFFPSFLDFAGVDNYDGVLDGLSIRKLLTKDSKELDNRAIFWQINSICNHGTCSAMRLGNYKMIQFLATGDVELYNLKTDPMESVNLIDKEPKVFNHMLRELSKWRTDNNVPLPPSSILSNNL